MNEQKDSAVTIDERWPCWKCGDLTTSRRAKDNMPECAEHGATSEGIPDDSLSVFEIMQRFRVDGSCERVIKEALEFAHARMPAYPPSLNEVAKQICTRCGNTRWSDNYGADTGAANGWDTANRIAKQIYEQGAYLRSVKNTPTVAIGKIAEIISKELKNSDSGKVGK